MKSNIFTFLVFTLCCILPNILAAQEYEIQTIHQGGGLVAVEVRFVGGDAAPTSADALLDFTIDLRWPAAANLDILSLENTGGYGISKAGQETIDGGDEFQGFQLITAPTFLPATWERDDWIEIFTVQFNSDGTTGETIAIGTLGSNPSNPNIPNINMSTADHTPAIVDAAVLPVALSSFTATKLSASSADLNWATDSEANTAYFTVERSTDARNWAQIGQVKANGESARTLGYDYLDEKIPPAVRRSGTVYYRLNIVDYDGFQEYSPVEDVQFEAPANALTVYPNPTADLLNIDVAETVTSVGIYDNMGRRVISTTSNQVNLRELKPGKYQVRVETGTEVFYKKVIKMN